jgi:hypothetical protein
MKSRNIKKIIDRLNENNLYLYIFIFIFYIVLTYLFPYVHDDWMWGSSSGINLLNNYFDNYNGRWVGNLFVIALTRSNLLKTLTMSFVLTGIIYLINKIIKGNKTTILLCFLLMLCTPKAIFMQGVAWTSGFVNYTISIFVILLFINTFINKKEESKKSVNYILYLLYVFLGFITVLFVENLTIFTVVLAFFLLIFYYLKEKKISISYFCYFLGSILGTILMFSNSAYSTIASGGDNYRSFQLSNFIQSSFDSYFNVIYKYLIFNNYILNICLTIIIIYSIYRFIKSNKINKCFNIYAKIISFVLITFTSYSILAELRNVNLLLKYTKYFNGLFTALFLLSILLFVILFIDKGKYKQRMLFYIGSIILMTLPLFVVTPIGSRNFFPTYVIFILFVCDLLNYLINKYNLLVNLNVINYVLLPIICVLMIYLLAIYGYIYKVYNDRNNYINNHLNDTVIVLPKMPNSSYIWRADPVEKGFDEQFKKFYNINSNSKIEVVSYKKWRNEYK